MLPPNYYDSEIKNLYCAEGMTMRQVADSLNIAAGKVYNRLKFMGIASRSHGEYEPTAKVRENCRIQGLKRKGIKHSEKTIKKISESKTIKGIGGKTKTSQGYIKIYFPDHPKSGNDGYILEHILVMECYLGRWLTSEECVHHINHIRDDNRLCNLRLMTKSQHASMHAKERNRQA